MATYILTIAGVERELRLGSLSLDQVINGADVASFTVLSPNRSVVPGLGEDALITEDGTAIFGGEIRHIQEEGPDGQPMDDYSAFLVTADSYNTYFQHRYVTDTFAVGTTIAQIATAFAAYLTGHGVTLSGSQVTGSSLTAVLDFSAGVRMDEALNRLTAITGYFGIIDPNKVFKLATAGTDAAPFTLADGDGNSEGDIRVTRSRDSAQPNAITLKFGPAGILDYTQSYTGDGVTDTFSVDFPIAGPFAYIADGAVGYGVVDHLGTESLGGLLSPMIWLYDPVNLTIFRTTGAPALGEAFTLRSQVQFPQTITVYAGGSPSSPLIEKVVTDASITNLADATAYATSLLSQAQTDKVEVEYATRLLSIRPGHTQTIEVTDRGVTSSSFLVTEVHASNEERTQELVREVRAIQGTQFRGASSDIYRDWLEQGNAAGGGFSTTGPAPSAAVPGVALRVAILRLSNDEIKAAADVPQLVVPAPAAGSPTNCQRIKILGASMRLKTESGAYTNIDPDYAACHLVVNGKRLSTGWYNDSATPTAKFSDLFGAAHDKVADIPVPAMDAISGFVGSPQGSPQSDQYVMGEDIASMTDLVDVDDAGVYLLLDNNGAGDFTGGHSTNRLKLTVYYVVEDVCLDWTVAGPLVQVFTTRPGFSGAIGNPHYGNPFGQRDTAVVPWQTDISPRFKVPIPAAGTLRNLRVTLASAAGAGASAFTIIKNGSATALSVTLTDPAITGDDTTNSVSIVDGDEVWMSYDVSGGAARREPTLSLEFESVDARTSIYCSACFPRSAGTYHKGPFVTWCQWNNATEGVDTGDVVGVAGNITRLRGLTRDAPGLGNSIVLSLVKNGVRQDGSGGTVDTRVTIADSATTAVASFVLPVVRGDIVSVQQVLDYSQSNAGTSFGVAFQATTDGHSQYCGRGIGTNLSNGNVRYSDPATGGSKTPIDVWETTEATAEQFGAITTFQLIGLVVALRSAPSSGKSYTFDGRVNGAVPSGAPSAVVSGTATTGSDNGAMTVASGDTFSIRATPSGTPDVTQAIWAFGQYVG